IDWLAHHSGALIPARTPGARMGVIEDAPGRYVTVRHGKTDDAPAAPSPAAAATPAKPSTKKAAAE
ncbi:hypothetical protein ABTJ98_21110, partial [Acinetobacter baumannii]